MKNTIFFLILLNPFLVMAQQMDYYPEQRPGVSDDDYKYGINILRETYMKVKDDGGIFNYADYWNIGLAFVLLKEDPAKAKELLQQSKAEDLEKFAKIFLYNDGLEQPNKWKSFLSKEEYEAILKAAQEAVPDESQRIQQGPKTRIKMSDDYNQSIISTFKSIQENDLKYRIVGKVDLEKQLILDQRNIEIIDLLYEVHNTYIGESFVGPQYKNVMWSVIQHSHLNAMEKYLPVIHDAAKRGDIQVHLLKRLLDRIYTLKYAYQIYGTQIGIPIGPLSELAEIRKQYEIAAVSQSSFPFSENYLASKEKAYAWWASLKNKQS